MKMEFTFICGDNYRCICICVDCTQAAHPIHFRKEEYLLLTDQDQAAVNFFGVLYKAVSHSAVEGDLWPIFYALIHFYNMWYLHVAFCNYSMKR